MNSVVIGVIVIVLIGGGFLLINGNKPREEGAMMPKDQSVKEEGAMMVKDTEARVMDESAMEEKEEGAMMQKGSYEAYASSKLAMAETGDVVLFFRASWCPTCRALDADIKASTASIPAGLTILDVNYDTETALKQKYGVTSQHTLVQVSADGTLLKKWSGGNTLASLATQVQ